VQFYAKAVPGLGYQTYRLTPQLQGEPVKIIEWGEQQLGAHALPQAAPAKNTGLQRKGFKIRNPFLKWTLIPKTAPSSRSAR